MGTDYFVLYLEMGSFTACFARYRFERAVPFLKNLAPWLLIITTMFGNGGIFVGIAMSLL